MPIRYRRFAALASSLAAALAFAPVQAQNYPSKPVRVIVPFAPGQAADLVARVLAEKLNKTTGATFVVENRPGAGGTLGVGMAAKAEPDGYTLVLATIGPLSQAPALYPHLSYSPIKDLAPITDIALTPTVLVSTPSAGYQSVQDLIAKAKARPGTINFASAGAGSNQHVTMELFKSRAGIDIVHIPYKGGSESAAAILAGTATIMFDAIPAVMPNVKAGKYKALAISTAKRSPLLPDVPTVAESGLPGFDAVGWMGLAAPAGTPEPVLDYLNQKVVAALDDPEVNARLKALAFTPDGMSRQKFTEMIRSENEKWGKVIREANIRLE
ncbi:tripartite tricarboxylate transporter substrate binding protein [Pigmentiphaga soli]|uniref:Tripartite tricarboxylate transporter substrate binding protein n=1 Tax=Pigmentiphaga soli TaxID=1007095 RepID=A0ABP8GLA7_9BURK